jgi:hypothetical protein
LLVAGNTLFWSDAATGNIFSVPLSGGPTTTVVGNLGGASALAADNQNLYFASCTSTGSTCSWTVNSVPLGGGTPVTMTPSSTGVFGLAVSGSTLFFLEEGNLTTLGWTGGAVMSVSTSGGTATTLASNVAGQVARLALTGSTLYFTCPSGGTINSLPTAGGTPTPVAQGLTQPWDVVTDGKNVYWTLNTTSGAIVQMSISGGTTTTLASGRNEPVQLAVDTSSVYWAESGDGVLMSVPIGGGTPTTLASLGAGWTPNIVAVGPSSLYFGARSASGLGMVGMITPK